MVISLLGRSEKHRKKSFSSIGENNKNRSDNIILSFGRKKINWPLFRQETNSAPWGGFSPLVGGRRGTSQKKNILGCVIHTEKTNLSVDCGCYIPPYRPLWGDTILEGGISCLYRVEQKCGMFISPIDSLLACKKYNKLLKIKLNIKVFIFPKCSP